jgi:hypothetical protein
MEPKPWKLLACGIPLIELVAVLLVHKVSYPHVAVPWSLLQLLLDFTLIIFFIMHELHNCDVLLKTNTLILDEEFLFDRFSLFCFKFYVLRGKWHFC